ncbi:hypothetical protein [Streptomyces pseudovenezuelae]|uniref:Uncharacterized protein n=1 Tax=Streptomyces pseudovenezuelae TaxID=67350 RepID=A0ABT6M1E6_9ACTN|nr:hypothetical protein [Streptomyces pseudovenezuelae]MDH6221474.1 hypothetical protein [Streptomyces pseudovenezuelae]
MAGGEQDPVFDFMVVRAPDAVDPQALGEAYIHDEVYVAQGSAVRRVARDLHTEDSSSEIGKLVHRKVLCEQPGESTEEKQIAVLLDESLKLAVPCAGPCEKGGMSTNGPMRHPLPLERLDAFTYVVRDSTYYLLPDRPELLFGVPLIPELPRIIDLLDAQDALVRAPDAIPALVARLETLLGAPLTRVVFTADCGHSADFARAKRELFDALYLLYIWRRALDVDLEPLIDGLRALHVLEALAIDAIVARIRTQGTPTAGERALLGCLAERCPGLRGWQFKGSPPCFPLIADSKSLARWRLADPVIHCLFARLFRYLVPFNPIRPIGIGDLKVVRQWLVAYRPGEISHIHNILKGETKTREHKRTEHAEDTFSFSATDSQENTRDVQSTQRFEVKNEAEAVVKSTLGVTANATVTYTSTPVVASLTAGFSYNRASDDTKKTAQNFARDVIDKAVSRVTEQTSTQRSTTHRLETEETNLQQFTNVKGPAHVSGMYRWVDKVYKAQIFNYGKRTMFEFLIPQPAAYWVQTRLRNAEKGLTVPQPPALPVYDEPVFPYEQDAIDAATYQKLRVDYDLEQLPVPVEEKVVALRQLGTNARYFKEKDLDERDGTRVFECHGDGIAGYRAEHVDFLGVACLHHKEATNRFTLEIADRMVWDQTHPLQKDWVFTSPEPPPEDLVLPADDTTVRLTFWGEIWWYEFSTVLHLRLTPERRAEWQAAVYAVVKKAELKKTAAVNEARTAEYERRLSQYRDEIAQLRATSVADALAGSSDAADKAVMDEEIKKHCLTLITKEFDSDAGDDVLPLTDALATRKLKPVTTRFEVDETMDPKAKVPVPPTTAGYKTEPDEKESDWPAIDLKVARAKGKLVQFLEQAFEWQHLSYLFYPYYWAEQPDWLELMDRQDDADPAFTAFLRAGMARVLVAVTPGYRQAVCYYLANRAPWSGGRTPVIGDDLFVSLHEEMREQTDDRLGGKAEGEPWTFVVPTTLVYLHDSGDKLPDLAAERALREGES